MTTPTVSRCHIVRRVDDQGTRPSVDSQAEVEKYVPGCGNLSLPSRSIVTRTDPLPSVCNIKIATINIQTLQDEIKLAMIVKHTRSLKIDVIAL